MGLKDRVALVTGGARGIGQGIAIRFAREGAHVVVCDLNAEGVKKVSQDIETVGCRSLWFEVDVSNSSQVDKMVKNTMETFGRIDILVNNAGTASPLKYFFEQTEEEWERIIRVNLFGTYIMMKAIVPVMMKQKYGRIVNISTGVVRSGSCGRANYVASKSAIEGLTMTAAKELAEQGITVNAVRPGYVKTPLTMGRGYDFEAIAKTIPRQRIGTPEDIAQMVTLLVQDEADYVTGQVIPVEGGWTLSGAGIIDELAPLKKR